MKVYQALAKQLEAVGVKHVFLVNGGANLWIIKGLCDETSIKIVPNAEEKNSAYAADAYARIAGFGVCLVTSGPGAAGIVSGIAASYQDSTPVLYIAGNTATFRRGKPLGVRNYGFQELDFVQMVSGITKYAVEPDRAEDVMPELKKCIHFALQGRKGPTVLSVPDDLQRMEANDNPSS